MRQLLILIAALSCAAVITVAGSANFSLQELPKESKTQPKEVVLDKDSQSDKYGEVAFNHENQAPLRQPGGALSSRCPGTQGE